MPANETHYYGWLVVESIVEVEEHNNKSVVLFLGA